MSSPFAKLGSKWTASASKLLIFPFKVMPCTTISSTGALAAAASLGALVRGAWVAQPPTSSPPNSNAAARKIDPRGSGTRGPGTDAGTFDGVAPRDTARANESVAADERRPVRNAGAALEV